VKKKLKLPLFLSFLLIASALQAAVFDVGTVTEFQNALTSAGDNGESDTINVQAGTYNISSTLTFWSGENYSLAIIGAGAGSTILDGGGAAQVLELITTAAGGDIILSYVTVQNGSTDYGGGAYLETNSATISIDHCDFIGNTSSEVGGGANAYSVTGDFDVSHCNFTGNTSGRAGGLFLQSEAGSYMNLTYSNFDSNSVTVDGGANMLYPLGSGVTLTIEHNTFTGNQSGQFGGGCWVRMPAGDATVVYRHNEFTGNASTSAGDAGGTYIEIQSGTLDYSNNTYTNNSSIQDGGGVWIYCVSGTLTLDENIYTGNHAERNGGGISVGIDEGLIVFSRNVLDSNSAANVGGGLSFATISGAVQVFNNTFYNNSASDGGGMYAYYDESGASSEVYNNILWHDSSPALSSSGAVSVNAQYSDIEDGSGESWFGTGCIDADPLFANAQSGDFRLTWDSYPTEDLTKSPCIDTGDPTSPLDPDGTRADMGALPFDYGTRITEYNQRLPIFSISMSPNPFNSTVRIFLSCHSCTPYCHSRESGNPGDRVEVGIFDINGRNVAEVPVGANLVFAQPQGNHKDRPYETVWQPDKSIPSGVYLVRATVGDREVTRKIVLLR